MSVAILSNGAAVAAVGGSRSTGKYSSTQKLSRSEAVRSKWVALRKAQELLPSAAVAGCQTRISGSLEVVRRVTADGLVYASYHGLATCKSVWACPVCAPRISLVRARELDTAIKNAMAAGLQVVMVTRTFSHSRGDVLNEQLEALKRADKRLRSGRKWVQFRLSFGVVGFVRALEVMHGERNGWHPHTHELWFFPAEADARAFGSEYRQLWKDAAAAAGLSMDEHGFRLDLASGRVAEYVAKFGREPRWTAGREMARLTAKRGRDGHYSPMQLLDFAAAGDERAGFLYREFFEAFKGKAQLFWSPRLRALLLGSEAELTDAEAAEAAEAAEVASSEVVCELSPRDWYWIYRVGAEADVLLLAERGGSEADIRAFIEVLGERWRSLHPEMGVA